MFGNDINKLENIYPEDYFILQNGSFSTFYLEVYCRMSD